MSLLLRHPPPPNRSRRLRSRAAGGGQREHRVVQRLQRLVPVRPALRPVPGLSDAVRDFPLLRQPHAGGGARLALRPTLRAAGLQRLREWIKKFF